MLLLGKPWACASLGHHVTFPVDALICSVTQQSCGPVQLLHCILQA
jgi:hypothetical protein